MLPAVLACAPTPATTPITSCGTVNRQVCEGTLLPWKEELKKPQLSAPPAPRRRTAGGATVTPAATTTPGP
mgnify:CR=1 FL=1